MTWSPLARGAGNILKMFAVEPEYQGGTFLADTLTELVGRGMAAGLQSFFIFTKPEYVTTFEGYNFSLLAAQEYAALLEYGRGIERWLDSHKTLIKPGNNGAIVMNCNPFTRGHRYVIEQAATQVDNLYVFIVATERSLFPFPVRMRLVREGVADLPNVQVLDTSRYAVSDVTLPDLLPQKGRSGGPYPDGTGSDPVQHPRRALFRYHPAIRGHRTLLSHDLPIQ